jgi:uncharacterized protein with FMN-binding domain
MRRIAPALAAAAALALPAANAVAATPKKKVVTTTSKVSGPSVDASRWGPLQVVVTIRTTTTTVGTKKTVSRKIAAIDVPVYPDHTDRSVFINQNALPVLVQEALKAQSAQIDLLSRATDSSDAFQQSLQGALSAAKVAKAGSSSSSSSI